MTEAPRYQKLVWSRHGSNWKLIVGSYAFEIISMNRGFMTARVIQPYEPTPPTTFPDDSVGAIGVSEYAPDPISEAQWCVARLQGEINRLRDARPVGFWELVGRWFTARRERIRAANELDGESPLW